MINEALRTLVDLDPNVAEEETEWLHKHAVSLSEAVWEMHKSCRPHLKKTPAVRHFLKLYGEQLESPGRDAEVAYSVGEALGAALHPALLEARAQSASSTAHAAHFRVFLHFFEIYASAMLRLALITGRKGEPSAN